MPDINPQIALATALLTNSEITRDDGEKVTEIFIGPQQAWKPGERNALKHGTVADLTEGTATDARIWSPLVLAAGFRAIIGGDDNGDSE